MRSSLALCFVFGAALAMSRPARACGGGVVTLPAATVGADGQRIMIAVQGGMTDVVTQIGVPMTSADYGVLIPVPDEPTLDPTPVSSPELDTLFSVTMPQVDSSTDSGCGCPLAAGSADKSGSSVGAARVSAPVAIGPVTAVTLTADTGDAINTWLADNGFAIPAGDQALVSAYAGTGRYFIAIRRNDTTASGDPTSVGVHFTLAGDQRGLPFRFVRMGAGPTVGITVLVVSDAAVAPSAPFAALTLHDLNGSLVKSSGYAAAVTAAVAAHGNHAFVVEGIFHDSDFKFEKIPSLLRFIPAGASLTRLSTLVPADALDTDVVFDQPFAASAPRELRVQRTDARARRPALAFGLAFIALAAVVRRRARATSRAAS